MSSPANPSSQHWLESLATLSYRSGELPAYLHQIAVGIAELIQQDWAVVTLCNGNQERILASSLDIGAAAAEIYELHGTLTGQVVNQGCPLVVEDAIADPQYGQAPEGYRAYLGVPLQSPNKTILGTICTFGRQPRHFTPEQIRLAEIFAERAAIALDNYHLYEQQCQLNARLAAEIEERKATEAALRESEARFRALVENAADSFLVINAAGRIVDCNQSACDTLGYRRAELLGLAIADIDSQLTAEAVSAFRQTLTAETTTTLESNHRRQDGSIFPIEARIRLFESAGQTLELSLVRDITERKQAEQARERLAEIGELAATIVHEVRNPLTAVWMGLQSFQSLDLSERYRQRLDFASEEAERLQRLLDEILLCAKQPRLQLEPLELGALVRELLPALQAMPAAAARRLQVAAARGNLTIAGDRDKLQQVLVNLVANACEAVAPGDTVTLRLAKRDRQIYCTVHNGGEPIPPTVLPQLTKPFFTTRSSGNGLGLAIVKRIAEAHGGELAIASTATDGTTATIRFPESSD